MSGSSRQIHLAAHFPGVNNTTVWSDPGSGSHIDFASFAHFAQTAERARFDFLFLAEGLRLREQRGRIHDLDVVGRPDTFTVLAALAAVGSQPRPSLVLLAFCAAQILAQIPITPGGLGFVEAGLTAMLTLAGVSAGAAVLATFTYRLFSYWLPLPVGLGAFGWHARRYR